jgi:23S rRNA (pseudouridine1915-N3)-methyltransferase
VGRRAKGEGGLKVRLLSVGRDRSRLFEPAIEAYTERLKHYVRLELLELHEPRGKRAAPASRLDEAERILAARRPGEFLVALDERGETLNTIGLARLLGEAQTRSQDLLFVVGGDDGLDPSVHAAANRVLSLSALTLPHRLARLVLVEQLYRGFSLLKGEPYHR